MEDLSSLLLQLKQLEQKINQQINQESEAKYKLIKNVQQNEKDYYRQYLNYQSKYILITLTFAPKKIFNSSFENQFYKLEQILDHFNDYQYFACFEKHKSEILHAHLLVKSSDIHSLTLIFNKFLYKLTDSTKLSPAINYKPVTQTKIDLNRAYNYIFEDKKDHPIYKYIQLNIE